MNNRSQAVQKLSAKGIFVILLITVLVVSISRFVAFITGIGPDQAATLYTAFDFALHGNFPETGIVNSRMFLNPNALPLFLAPVALFSTNFVGVGSLIATWTLLLQIFSLYTLLRLTKTPFTIIGFFVGIVIMLGHPAYILTTGDAWAQFYARPLLCIAFAFTVHCLYTSSIVSAFIVGFAIPILPGIHLALVCIVPILTLCILSSSIRKPQVLAASALGALLATTLIWWPWYITSPESLPILLDSSGNKELDIFERLAVLPSELGTLLIDLKHGWFLPIRQKIVSVDTQYYYSLAAFARAIFGGIILVASIFYWYFKKISPSLLGVLLVTASFICLAALGVTPNGDRPDVAQMLLAPTFMFLGALATDFLARLTKLSSARSIVHGVVVLVAFLIIFCNVQAVIKTKDEIEKNQRYTLAAFPAKTIDMVVGDITRLCKEKQRCRLAYVNRSFSRVFRFIGLFRNHEPTLAHLYQPWTVFDAALRASGHLTHEWTDIDKATYLIVHREDVNKDDLALLEGAKFIVHHKPLGIYKRSQHKGL